MNFTDTEVGMAMAHQRSMRAFSRDAQGLVDEMDRDIVELRAQLAACREVILDERAGRLAAELKVGKLQALLDLPI